MINRVLKFFLFEKVDLKNKKKNVTSLSTLENMSFIVFLKIYFFYQKKNFYMKLTKKTIFYWKKFPYAYLK